MIEYKYIEAACGAYLCDFPPPECVEWSNEEMYAWIEDNLWEPLDGFSGQRIWEAIEAHALCIERLCNE